MKKITYLATGGTIASRLTDDAAGVLPVLGAADLVEQIPQLQQVADIEAIDAMREPSASFGLSHAAILLNQARQAIAGGADGVVISQGTDSIDEMAFVLDLLWDEDAPLVVTGAMRNPSQPGGDGPANLLAAVQAAASPATRGLGVLVVLNEEIHAARLVKKSSTFLASAFTSPGYGPIGAVIEGQAMIGLRPRREPALEWDPDSVPPVALYKTVLGDDGRLLDSLPGLGYQGLVVEGFGGGHVPKVLVPRIKALVPVLPVILASKVASGPVLRSTYGFEGSEISLQQIGVIASGIMDGPKARLLLTVLLSGGCDREVVAREFAVRGYLPGS